MFQFAETHKAQIMHAIFDLSTSCFASNQHITKSYNRFRSLVVKVSDLGVGDQGSIPGRVITNILKWL